MINDCNITHHTCDRHSEGKHWTGRPLTEVKWAMFKLVFCYEKVLSRPCAPILNANETFKWSMYTVQHAVAFCMHIAIYSLYLMFAQVQGGSWKN